MPRTPRPVAVVVDRVAVESPDGPSVRLNRNLGYHLGTGSEDKGHYSGKTLLNLGSPSVSQRVGSGGGSHPEDDGVSTTRPQRVFTPHPLTSLRTSSGIVVPSPVLTYVLRPHSIPSDLTPGVRPGP